MAMLREREGKAKAAPTLVIPKDFSGFVSNDDGFYAGLTEKSAQDRKEALCKTAAAFQTLQISEDDLELNHQTIIEALKRSFRNDDQEKTLASRILALMAITNPNYCASLTQDFEDILEKSIKTKTEQPSTVPVEAVRAWGALLFINADDNKTMLVLDKLLNILTESENSFLQSAILETITLCVTTFSSEVINHEIIPKYGPEIEALILSTEDWNLQVAASQCLAVLFALFREEHDSDEDLENCVSVQQVVEYLESFASMKILSLSNEEQKSVRNKFKESLRVITDDYCPEEERSIENHKFTFDNWRKVTQIRWFADKLQGGLPSHFTQNPFLQEVFDVDADLFHNSWSKRKRSRAERRVFSKNSATSKERTLERRRTQRKAI